MHSKLIIVGSGPAGWTAALYAARAGLKPLVITGYDKGGQLMTTTTVDNWPGDVNGIMGPDLMQRLEDHAVRFGAEVIIDFVSDVNFDTQPYTVTTESGDSYTCDSMIIATGASAKYLGLPSEQEFLGRGVSGCATCDGFFYEGKEVAVVGGGNTAVEEALYLSNIASKVHLIHRRDTFKAEQIMIDQLMDKVSDGKIVLHLNSQLAEVMGNDDGVHSIRITGNNTSTTIWLPGVFIAIGHKPNTDLFKGKGKISLDDYGFIKTTKGLSFQTGTGQLGVFACGDVSDPIYRQAITSAGSGCQSALDAVRYLELVELDKKVQARAPITTLPAHIRFD
jgi:thioredoxin reductase (NADPH)